MKRSGAVMLFGAVLAGLVVGESAMAAKREAVLFVFPARYRLTQLAFDVLRLRPETTLLACSATAKTGLGLHVWTDSEWVRISIEDLAACSFMPSRPARVIVIGDDNTCQVEVSEALGWARNVERLATNEIGPIVNWLAQSLGLTERELRWLAGRYDLDVVDLNADQRRRDSYAKPWSEILPPRHDKPERLPPRRQAPSITPVPALPFQTGEGRASASVIPPAPVDSVGPQVRPAAD